MADSFDEFDLPPDLREGIAALGWIAPTPIQSAALPPGLAGRDVVGQARTGSGKTGAFGLPVLQAIDLERRVVQALVLCPTRELATQVADAVRASTVAIIAGSAAVVVGVAVGFLIASTLRRETVVLTVAP